MAVDPRKYSSMAPENFKARQAAENNDPNKLPPSGNLSDAIQKQIDTAIV